MPDNNFYLLRANINNDYLENHVWSKCGRKYGFEAIDHSNKSLSYNTLHYTYGRVVEIFRKQKFYGFQVRKPYRLFKTIVVSIITFFKRDSSIIRFLIVPNSVQLKMQQAAITLSPDPGADFTEFEEFKTSQTNKLSNLLVWQKLKFKIQRSPLQE